MVSAYSVGTEHSICANHTKLSFCALGIFLFNLLGIYLFREQCLSCDLPFYNQNSDTAVAFKPTASYS